MAGYVPIDLHRRRSVVMHLAEDGEMLGWRRIANDPGLLVEEVLRHGEAPQVAIEATYGWYWTVDELAAAGCDVRLVNTAAVRGLENRRVENDVKDCELLGTLMRTGTLPEAWIAPPVVREWRELVRYRAKLVGVRSGLKAQVHSVLAKLGIQCGWSDLFGVSGRELLARRLDVDPRLHSAFGQRIESILELIDVLDAEVAELDDSLAHILRDVKGYDTIQRIPGVGKVIAAIFCAEIGDVTRFSSASRLVSWAGLAPRHRESDTKVRRGRITKQGSTLVRWAAIEAAQRIGRHHWLAAWKQQVADRRGSTQVARVACARRIIELTFYGLRDGHIRALAGAR
ncbi:MAG: IS110 family transposase [Actinobacteria bacterium]|nr:IS110 family transposase [Actinomycetota bacterium]